MIFAAFREVKRRDIVLRETDNSNVASFNFPIFDPQDQEQEVIEQVTH